MSRWSAVPLGRGLSAAWAAGYTRDHLRRDVLAGLTIGVIAVPLSMALAIATGVPPQHGLYTALVAGALIALTGGSRFNVSGPTAAFVAILFPVVAEHGLGGLLLATLMSGVFLMAMGLTGLGRLIQFVPYPVILGFTSGIAVVIAILQVPDLLGLTVGSLGAHVVDNVARIVSADAMKLPELIVALSTLTVLIVWSRRRWPLPPALVGLAVGSAVAAVLMSSGHPVEIVDSRFSWTVGGESGAGIPPFLPSWQAPWLWPGGDGQPLVVNFALIRDLLPAALAIALLGAIESLLCAVIADGLTRTRHDPNGELMGQGIGNVVAPWFGGITATAALARTATNIRSGAYSPVAALVHAGVVLLALVLLTDVLGQLPLAALAALLMMVAWNMAEAGHFWKVMTTAPRGDVVILLTCFVLTVLFDMVLAVGVGIALACALFIRRMALTTEVRALADDVLAADDAHWPDDTAVYRIQGPLFFAVSDQVLETLRRTQSSVRTLVVSLDAVPSIDGTTMVGLVALTEELRQRQTALILCGVPTELVLALRRAGVRSTREALAYVRDARAARALAWRWHQLRLS